jgi:hypothetical protein
MDLLAEIRRKIEALPEANRSGPMEVVRHLEQCERLLVRGRDREPEFFNDIVYRTNQAFEGALKEAYRALESKDPDKITLHKIEQHLTKNSIVRPKVASLMQNYRMDWRNPSTHDYTLRFDESEGVLALTSVSAFFLALLGQIQDKLAIKDITLPPPETIPPVKVHGDEFINEVAIQIVRALFSLGASARENISEQQAVLLLVNALSTSNPNWKIEIQPAVNTPGGVVLRPDLLVESNGRKTIIEVQMASGNASRRASAVEQLKRYIRAAAIRYGILLWMPGRDHSTSIESREQRFPMSDASPEEAVIAEIGFTSAF